MTPESVHKMHGEFGLLNKSESRTQIHRQSFLTTWRRNNHKHCHQSQSNICVTLLRKKEHFDRQSVLQPAARDESFDDTVDV
ncbi:hypothetical protein P692DRAFT_20596972 [Suillus brevipes Sb2]|jgi:hypothetical protein|nr:hypothetical protein P692DRAFT_20596972 [Suillus brevipes Sb2]